MRMTKELLDRVQTSIRQRQEPTPFVEVSDNEELEAGKIINIEGVKGKKVIEEDASRLSDRFDGRYFAEHIDHQTGSREAYNPIYNARIHGTLKSRLSKLRNHLNDLAHLVVDCPRYGHKVNNAFARLKEEEANKQNAQTSRRRRASVLLKSEKKEGKADNLLPPKLSRGTDSSKRDRSGTVTSRPSAHKDLLDTTFDNPLSKNKSALVEGEKVSKKKEAPTFGKNSTDSESARSEEFTSHPFDLTIDVDGKPREQQLYD